MSMCEGVCACVRVCISSYMDTCVGVCVFVRVTAAMILKRNQISFEKEKVTVCDVHVVATTSPKVFFWRQKESVCVRACV